MMAITESVIINQRTRECVTTPGNNGSEKRTNPYVPIFSKTPARMTDPAVGASTCASGSQVWNGNTGTLIANPRKNAKNSHTAYWNGICGAVTYNAGMLNV